jgi:hypothetical protein
MEYLLAELLRRRLWNAAIWHMQLLSREICIPATAETKVMTSTVNKETNSISCFMISRLSAGLERLEDNKARLSAQVWGDVEATPTHPSGDRPRFDHVA